MKTEMIEDVVYVRMQKGQRDQLSKYIDTDRKFMVGLHVEGSSFYNYTCFGIDENEKISDERYIVSYRHASSPNGEIVYSEIDQGVVFYIDLPALPSSVVKLMFTVSIVGQGTMGTITTHELALVQDQRAAVQFEQDGRDFQRETAITSLMLYKRSDWRIHITAAGSGGGLAALLRRYGCGTDIIRTNDDDAAPFSPEPGIRQEAGEPSEDLQSCLDELNGMIGLNAMKSEVHTLINVLRINKMRQAKGSSGMTLSQHLVFSGNPGTGKTTVARLLGKIYKALGILSGGHLVEVDRSKLVAGYVGQTAITVSNVIREALGGILFIDEAYSLTVGTSENDFGKEAVDTLLKAMEDHRDDLVVIAAGYPDLMDEFLESNPGLRSRFNKFIHFEDYTPAEMADIFRGLVRKNGYHLARGADERLNDAFAKKYRRRGKGFANGRTVRNFFEDTVSRQANRLAVSGTVNDAALFTLTAEDLQLDAAGAANETENVNDLLRELNDLIGLPEMKKEVTTLVNVLKVNQLRREKGLPESPMSRHLVFSGNPGTGKTTVARLLARIYKALGVLSGGQLIEVDRSKLVAGYVGQTAGRVAAVVNEALGGILFIDEAYSLTVGRSENDFGFEAVDTLLKAMEDHRSDLIVIAAGYPDLMNEFLESNPGLRSRFNKFIRFEDYTPEEMVQIFLLFASKANYKLDSGLETVLLRYFKAMRKDPSLSFANGRTVRNYFEAVITNQSNRLAEAGNVTEDELITIRLPDLKTVGHGIGGRC